MNIDQPKNPDPSRYSHWCEYGQHWHIIGATYQCGPDTEERERARQYQKEEDERYRASHEILSLPELIKELEAEVARLKAENEQLTNITLVSVEIES